MFKFAIVIAARRALSAHGRAPGAGRSRVESRIFRSREYVRVRVRVYYYTSGEYVLMSSALTERLRR